MSKKASPQTQPSTGAAVASPRARRIVRRVLGVVACAYLGYVLLGNLFLNTALSDAAFNRKPERFTLHWQRAFTWWPGSVTAWQVEARGHARRVQWQARAESASAHIALWPLLRRELRIDPIDAERVQFDAQRVETDLPPPASKPGAWIVHVPRIRSQSVQRARWEGGELRGVGEVEFGLWKQLRGGALEILPSRMRWRDATLRLGDTEWSQDVNLDADFALTRHLAADAPGLARLDLMQIAVQLDATAPHLSGALGKDDWLRLDVQPGGGRVSANLSLAQGELKAGGSANLALPLHYTDADGVQRDNTLVLDLGVDEGVTLHADLPALADGIGSLGADLRVRTRRIPRAGVKSLLPLLDGEATLDWRFESLRWLSDAIVHNDWLNFDGAGQLTAQVKIAAGQLLPGTRIEIPAVRATTRVLQDRIEGTARAVGELLPGAVGAPPHVRLQIDLEKFEVAAEADPATAYVRGRNLHLDLQAEGSVARLRETLRGTLTFSDAEIPDLTAYNAYFPRRNLAFTGGSGRLGLELELDAAGRVGTGRVRLAAKRAAMRFSDLRLQANVALDARLKRADLDALEFDLGGTTLRLDQVAYSKGEEAATGWWARLSLPSSRLRWGRPFQLDADVQVQAKDVGFVLALFAQRRSYPRWAMRLLDAGQASVTSQVQLRGDVVTLDRLRASNDRFHARARLQLQDKQRHGDLLLGWSKLDLGVELRDAERKWHLRHAEAWFEQGKPLLSATPR